MNLTFAISGSITNYTRKELEKIISTKGHKLIDDISKYTDYLICNDESSNTEKVTFAHTNKITIIDENDLFYMLNVDL